MEIMAARGGLYCLNGHFVFEIIIIIVGTRWQILRLKCTKFDFVWVFAQPPLGELTALPQIPSWRGEG